ncbi:MAG: hypothetical protein HQ522_01180 [Bacteroidetes bacterium]|nr:hypothetical protein [Bacteroidota bacterium]
MAFESPDIDTFKYNLDSTIQAVQKHKLESHSAIKIQSLLNLTVYVMATRFLEGCVKHIVYNCSVMRGDNQATLATLEDQLKGFNNPEFKNIKELFEDKLGFDLLLGKGTKYEERDITFLNEIVRNRHKNVHASSDCTEWYNQNKKDLSNYEQEYEGLIKILEYLDSITYDTASGQFTD